MGNINFISLLNKIYGPLGLPFPGNPNTKEQPVIVSGFEVEANNPTEQQGYSNPLRKFDAEDLGSYLFLPAKIDGYELPNAIVMIAGDKEIVETDVTGVGTVFEKVFTKPYDISIVCTLLGLKGEWPGLQLREMANLWKKDEVVTLKCALTENFIQPENNLVIMKMQILDPGGAENVEVLQIDARSNIDFELELL